jgi:hypothetical protein
MLLCAFLIELRYEMGSFLFANGGSRGKQTQRKDTIKTIFLLFRSFYII